MTIEVGQVINFVLPLLVGVVGFFLKKLFEDSRKAVGEAQTRVEQALERAAAEREKIAAEIKRVEGKLDGRWEETRDRFHDIRSLLTEVKGESMIEVGELDKRFTVFSTDIERRHNDNRTILIEVRNENLKIQQQLAIFTQGSAGYESKVIKLESRLKALSDSHEKYMIEVQELRKIIKK